MTRPLEELKILDLTTLLPRPLVTHDILIEQSQVIARPGR